MQHLNELNAIIEECNRIVDSMLNGQMTHDDGLFTTAATLRKVANEFTQFVAYALPLLHTIEQAMRAAQTQAAQAAQAMQAAQAAQAVQAVQAVQAAQAAQSAPAQPTLQTPQNETNVVPINASANVQRIDGAPGGQR